MYNMYMLYCKRGVSEGGGEGRALRAGTPRGAVRSTAWHPERLGDAKSARGRAHEARTRGADTPSARAYDEVGDEVDARRSACCLR